MRRLFSCPMPKKHHIPIRTCVACRETDEKRDLLRVVRQPDGTVCYDSKGKLSGRGAYICAREACIALARKQKKLERSLKVSGLTEVLFQELSACATAQPTEQSQSLSPVGTENAPRTGIEAPRAQESEGRE